MDDSSPINTPMEQQVASKTYIAGGKHGELGLLVDVGAVKGAERWSRDRDEAMHVTPAQARKVIAVLQRTGIVARVSA